MKNKLYYLDVEVKAGDNCKLSPNVIGAFVNCYVFEKSSEIAHEKILKALIEDNYLIVKIVDAYETSLEQFKVTEKLSDIEMEEFINSNDVYYGAFYGWKKD